DAVVPRVPRVECEREEALLGAPADLAAQVEERRRAALALDEDDDPARLLDDVQAVGGGPRGGSGQRPGRPAGGAGGGQGPRAAREKPSASGRAEAADAPATSARTRPVPTIARVTGAGTRRGSRSPSARSRRPREGRRARR